MRFSLFANRFLEPVAPFRSWRFLFENFTNGCMSSREFVVRYVTGIIVFQIVPQLARKFCCSYSQWNWKTREWDVGDKTNWYKKLSKNKNQKKWRFMEKKKKEERKNIRIQISLLLESNSSKRLFSAKIKIIIILWLSLLMFSCLSFNFDTFSYECVFSIIVSSCTRKISFLFVV